jgi:hypothetical protein
MTHDEIIEKHLEAATNRAYFMGAILGMATGFVAGALIWSQFI